MLAGGSCPTGFEARADDDGALCYRLSAEDVVPCSAARPACATWRAVYERPRPDAAALPVGHDPTHQRASQLVRDRPVVCEPSASVREAARTSAEERGELGAREARRSALRDPHRPRPARARGRRRSVHRRARHGGDDRARVLRRAGAVRRRGDARDARPRGSATCRCCRRSATRWESSPTPSCLRPRPRTPILPAARHRLGRDRPRRAGAGAAARLRPGGVRALHGAGVPPGLRSAA